MVTSLDSATAPTLKGRTLVLCFDGTSNQYDGDNTNVVKFYSLLKKNITDEQLCYYQPGIGTYIQPGVVAPVFEWWAKIIDEAVAWYLDAHVRGGYTFLMQNWRPGDKICIFGFSRGAYTARALAGFLHKIGLLPKDNPEQVPFAYKMFKKTDPESVQLAAGFKQTFCRSVQIEFVGVWDTVASVGVLVSKTLPFTTTNTTIKTFRHALSLDERRAKFQPNLFHRLSPDATRTVHDLEAEMGIDQLQSEENSPIIASPTSTSAINPPSLPLSPPDHPSQFQSKSEERQEQGQGCQSTNLGTPPGHVNPRGVGDAWRPFPNVRQWARKGNLKRVKEEKEFWEKQKGRGGGGWLASLASGFGAIGKKSKKEGEGKKGEGKGKRMSKKELVRSMGAVDDPCDDFVGLTNVLEVWFAGGHGDVGGGATLNSAPHALSDIPLRWMVRQVVQAQCGIQFDNDAILRAGIPMYEVLSAGFVCAGMEGVSVDNGNGGKGKGKIQPTLHFFTEPKEKKDTLLPADNGGGIGVVEVSGPMLPDSPDSPVVHALGGSGNASTQAPNSNHGVGVGEGGEGVRKSEDSTGTHTSAGTTLDAIQPIDDELARNKLWWLLEIVPTSYTYQDGRGVWHTKWGLHLGKGRYIPDYAPTFHESVKERMENGELKYTPRATWKKGSEKYVS
ncbi:hypothetical protein BDY19DRAFT_344031 [Irpex rosettiformis]|uniref:Uncharacterized protein n=1 Tax=Irpex rosettiformis TaxID=378272 RepID=A0ACB8TWK0_9APHY|nr:hypothetical protein BDY19DRAFT_344031 [Irpex rosettiformis]